MPDLSFANSVPATSSNSDARASLRGWVERVTFHTEETGYSVIRVRPDKGRELITVLGTVPQVSPGERIEAQGVWVQNAEYGRQLKADNIRLSHPDTLEGLEKYLGSGLIDGIGPKHAKSLVEKFGTDFFRVVEEESARLEEAPGIGAKRRKEIRESWMKQKAVHEIMVFLHQHGIGSARAQRIHKTYGANAVEVLKTNPYRLAVDVHGVGFKTADEIASQMGIAHEAPQRVKAGLVYTLEQVAQSGHTCLPRELLLEEGGKILGVNIADLDAGLQALLSEGSVVAKEVSGQERIFLPELEAAEERIASRLHELLAQPSTYPPMDFDKAMAWWETRSKQRLAESQKTAVREALRQRVLIITGGPGVGKTTIVNTILAILQAKKVEARLAAPTGRAAQRLSESTGLEATTLHRLLEFQGEGIWGRHGHRRLEGDLFVVDESSMVDVPLMAHLIAALPDDAHLLLVGDADQLPSVGPGAVLHDLLGSRKVPFVRLTEVFRQAAASRIITAAHAINQGHMPDLKAVPDSDFFFLERESPEDIAGTVVQLMKDRLPSKYGFDPVKDIQVLCPMNRQALGTRAFNAALQEALNPPNELKFEIERFGQTYRVGDKVLQTRNNYEKEVFNGDIGSITSMDTEPVKIHVRFEGGRHVTYEPGDLDELQLAYAITIHKSQGSEFPCIVLPIAMSQFIMLERSLIYTGLTRGKKLVVLVGEAKALAKAVRETQARRRWTSLKERMTAPEENPIKP